MVSGTSCISKKVKEQGLLRKSRKKYPSDPGSDILDPKKFIPDPGGKKAPDPVSGSATLGGRGRFELGG
jgi:hypothetical protein